MANSKCPKCENSNFEVKEDSPAHSNYKLILVQCSRCGSVVGTMDYFNIGTKINELEKKVDKLLSVNGSGPTIEHINILNQNIARLFNSMKSGFESLVLSTENANKKKNQG